MITPVAAYTESLIGDVAKDHESLHIWQMQKAFQMLLRAKNNSPFYAKRFVGIDESKMDERNWLEVPTMSAKDLTDSFALLCVPNRDVARVISISTSGTIIGKRLLFSKEDLEATVAFFMHGMSTMVDHGEHVTVLMRGHEPNTIGDLLTKGLSRIGVSASVHFPFDDTAGHALINADCLVGLPVPMLRLARMNPNLHFQTVLLSADYVPQSIISGIESVWGCRVLTHYGLTETGYGLGVQCLHKNGYHLRDAEFLCEILDEKTQHPVAPGEMGEVTLTTLSSRAMPLIRYRTGDLARMNQKPCTCGASLPTLDKVMGRIGDDGEFSMPKLDEAVFSVDTVYDMRAALKGGCIWLIVYCKPGSEMRTKRAIWDALGQPLDITFATIPMQLKKRRIDVIT